MYTRIVLVGKMGSGKSTAAKYLADHYGYRIVKFSKRLKDMCRKLGMSEDQIEGYSKHIPDENLCGRTPRHIMQTLGTDWGRKLIGADLWVRLWAKDFGSTYRPIADDCRFLNEAEQARFMGAVIVKLVRPKKLFRLELLDEFFESPADTIRKVWGHLFPHPSEREIDKIKPDITIVNDGDVSQLEEKLDAMVKIWRE